MSSSGDDLYALLGVPTDAEHQAIRAAYRRRARATHPDRGGSSAEFQQVQAAWEVLGSAEARAAYDRQQQGQAPPESRTTTTEGAGFTYQRHQSSTRRSPRSAAAEQPRSPQADQPPVYEPELNHPEPLNLTLTSQRVHGQVTRSKGLFSGGKSLRLQERTVALLEKHLLSSLPAARIFNDVLLEPVPAPRTKRAPKGERAEHVVLVGDMMVVVASADVPASTAVWDGRTLRARGKNLNLPQVTAQARKLRATCERLLAESGLETTLQAEHQVILYSPEGDLFHPVVEHRGAAQFAHPPQAAGRAMGHIANLLAASPRANVVNRHLIAALRHQVVAP